MEAHGLRVCGDEEGEPEEAFAFAFQHGLPGRVLLLWVGCLEALAEPVWCLRVY